MISGTPVERVSSFKYLGVNISEDLTRTTHIQTQVKKARQRLYHLRQLRKFRVSPAILKTFYSGAIESVLTQCISVWYSNATNQDCKALQRVVRLAEHISGSALPSLQDIYLKWCKSRATKIIKDSNHPGNRLFILLPSGKRFRSMMAKTERLLPSGHQAPKLSLITFTFTWLNLMCTYPVQPCLHIPLAHPCLYYYLLSPQYTVLHILFHCTFYPLFFSYFYFILTYIYIYSLVLGFILILIFLHCPLSGPVLIYISLLIISCVIEYVTNKRTLTLTLKIK